MRKIGFKSIQTKLMGSFVFLTVFLTVVSSIVTYFSENRRLMEGIKHEAEGFALGASLLVDGDLHQIVEASQDMDSEEYSLIKENLQRFQETTGVMYIYTMIKNGDSTQFIVDADEEEPEELGSAYDMLPNMNMAFEGTASSDDEIYTDDWGAVLSGYAPIKNSNGEVVAIVGIDIDASRIHGEQLLIIRDSIINLVAIVVLIFILSFITARKIAKPIYLLDKRLKELSTSGGDLTASIKISTGDELERLGNSVTAFISNIRDIIEKVMHTAEDVNISSSNLSSSVTYNTKVIENTSYAINSIATGSNQQAGNIEQINSKIQSIYSVISRNNKDIKLIEDSVIESGQFAQTGINTVGDLNDKTERNLDAFQSTLHTINKLEEDIKGIGEITNTITYISEQINLLALNASIEAARAGEAGKGFEVVANEIKSLAYKSSESASNIEQLIKQISSDSKTAATNMQVVKTTLEEQKTSVSSTETSFHGIYSKVHGLVDNIGLISKSFQKVNEEVENITIQMKDILSIAQENAVTVEEVSAGSEEQSTSMNDLELTAKNLNQLSLNLKQNVSKFKI
ncbi:MAG: Methyl-accepting chemotaxis protein [Lachnospiraceae bacterium]|jgi:methyl-accepting chemotaxis protein|nr:Methyl-accepting chemotaxis protein [Lachnospiraceae bacterium]